MSAPRTVAVVPLKALASAKSRLSEVLSEQERQELVASLFDGVLRACLDATRVDQVLVVAGDAPGLLLADAERSLALLEPAPGLAGALALADAQLERMGAESSLVVVADLPFVRAGDLDRLCAAAPDGPCVVVAPAGDGGTGALFRRPATVIPTAFGPGSAAAHLAAARAAGVPALTISAPGLAWDLDTPEQLTAMRSAGLLDRVPPA